MRHHQMQLFKILLVHTGVSATLLQNGSKHFSTFLEFEARVKEVFYYASSVYFLDDSHSKGFINFMKRCELDENVKSYFESDFSLFSFVERPKCDAHFHISPLIPPSDSSDTHFLNMLNHFLTGSMVYLDSILEVQEYATSGEI